MCELPPTSIPGLVDATNNSFGAAMACRLRNNQATKGAHIVSDNMGRSNEWVVEARARTIPGRDDRMLTTVGRPRAAMATTIHVQKLRQRGLDGLVTEPLR